MSEEIIFKLENLKGIYVFSGKLDKEEIKNIKSEFYRYMENNHNPNIKFLTFILPETVKVEFIPGDCNCE